MAAAFTVSVRGDRRSVAPDGVAINGAVVTLTLETGGEPLRAGDYAGLCRARRQPQGGLAAGGPIRAGTGHPPTVTSVAVTSDAGSYDTYRKDDVIQVTVTFSEAVDVDTADGTPRLTIKMNPEYGEKWAAGQGGSGSTSLTFTHTVVEPNLSTQGTAVLADTLQLNGGRE